jgi:hypothetical protein
MISFLKGKIQDGNKGRNAVFRQEKGEMGMRD